MSTEDFEQIGYVQCVDCEEKTKKPAKKFFMGYGELNVLGGLNNLQQLVLFVAVEHAGHRVKWIDSK